MSRPLELTVFEKNDVGYGEYYEMPGTRSGICGIFAADAKALNKHLTMAECAAEFWHSWNLFKTGSPEHRDWTEYDRANTLRRFAQTPHHDELPDRRTA